MDEQLIVWMVSLAISGGIVAPYLIRFHRRQQFDRSRKLEAIQLGIDRPIAQFPYVDPRHCIGCASCVAACPEGDVLGVVGGTAVVINGLRCVGHGSCEDACPVGAIEVGLGDLKARADVPLLDDDLQTTVPGIFIAGELGGLSLVRNAAQQGRRVAEGVAERFVRRGSREVNDAVDLTIVGSGPAGLSAGLTAATRGLTYVILEKEKDLGGSILHYPRRKMVLTQPVELPPWGALDREEYEKEELLGLFEKMAFEAQLNVRFGQSVTRIERQNGFFLVGTNDGSVASKHVLLALGRRGSPRKLGVPGEDRPKVMYRLIDAQSYRGQRILIVGGGDSAAEAAVGLARQPGNHVTLSYRRDRLVRLKRKNLEWIERLIERQRIQPLFASHVTEIGDHWVDLEVEASGRRRIDNDFVFVFAGGEPPFGFLRDIGVRFGGVDLSDRSREAAAASN